MGVAATSIRRKAVLDVTHFDVLSPVTGQVVGEVPNQSPGDVIAAIERGREAQKEWASWSFRDRAKVLRRYHDMILADQDDLFDVLQAETGKSRRDCFVEVFAVAAEARYYAVHGWRYLKPRRVQAALPIRTRAKVIYRPVGVVGIISPWNFPFILSVNDAIPALLAGNAVVNKPSLLTPLSAIWNRDKLMEAGLPEGVFQVVTGPGKELGETLTDHADFMMFTGSSAVGKQVAQRAAARLIPFSMELGGKNAMLVLEDADIKHAARVAIEGSFNNCGQVCVNWERIMVHESIYDPFMDEMKSQISKLRMGATRDFDTDLGSMINARQIDTVEEHIRDAVGKGATIASGGKRRGDLGPNFFEPTVLENVTPQMAVYDEETFGPLVSVYQYSSLDEAIDEANKSKYGLHFGVFTGKRRKGEKIAERLDAGSVAINDTYVAWAAMEAPMGGFKDSGIGRRHGGADGIRKYTEAQAIVTNTTGWQISSYETALSINARLAKILTLLLRVWRHIPFIR